MRSAHFDAVASDLAVGRAVAEHKSCFFSEKEAGGDIIDYFAAIGGALHTVPEDAAQEALATDYAKCSKTKSWSATPCPSTN